VDVQSLKKANDGYAYLLTCIDVFSKYAWCVPIKDKTGKSLVAAFKLIFKKKQTPRKLQTDKGTEFKNQTFQAYLKGEGVKFFTTENDDIKASVVERFNRTLKERLWRYFTFHHTFRYIDDLPKLVQAYNASHHRSIKMAPEEVNFENQETVWQTLYEHTEKFEKQPPKLKVGDRVRLSKTRQVFKKGYLPGWTLELFTVHEVYLTDPTTYSVVDDKGEVLQGTFYIQELQKVAHKPTYRIETVIRQRKKRNGKKEYLVRWLGYDSSFDSWVPKETVTQYSV
jgi:hypothetical protein